MVELEMGKCQLMKSKFLQFARNEIVKGYVKVVRNQGWTIEGQQITKKSHVYQYIQINKCDNKLRKELHFLQYKMFKVDALLVW